MPCVGGIFPTESNQVLPYGPLTDEYYEGLGFKRLTPPYGVKPVKKSSYVTLSKWYK